MTTPTATSTSNAVPQADPTHIAIPAVGVDADVRLFTEKMAQGTHDNITGASCWTDDTITCVNPPDGKRVYWLKAGVGRIPFGSQPGTDATGTVYLTGHSSSSTTAVFTDLYKLKTGDPISVSTRNGDVSYEVQKVVMLDKNDWSDSPYANEQVAGRLLLITCNHEPGSVKKNGSAVENALVVAQLVS